MDINRNIKMIQNKINRYNLPNYNQFLSDSNQVRSTLESLGEEEEKFQTYLQEISIVAKNDTKNFGDRIDKNTA
jgi:hypothetical protein